MEYTQWEWASNCRWIISFRLNPCCNGIYSMSPVTNEQWHKMWCLNPCCNGIYSMREDFLAYLESKKVLILVVMEYTQWVPIEELSDGLCKS